MTNSTLYFPTNGIYIIEVDPPQPGLFNIGQRYPVEVYSIGTYVMDCTGVSSFGDQYTFELVQEMQFEE